QHAQRTDGQADIRMNVDRPDATKRDEAGQRFQRKANHEGRQVDDADRVDRIERMLAMGREPVEMLGDVVHRMKAPQETDAMAVERSTAEMDIEKTPGRDHFSDFDSGRTLVGMNRDFDPCMMTLTSVTDAGDIGSAASELDGSLLDRPPVAALAGERPFGPMN